MTKIVAISGSLRAGSSNTAALRAAARLVPEGVEVLVFDGIAALPFFNPDLDGDVVPAPVGAMRALIGAIVSLFEARVPVWLVFALGLTVWLMTAGLFVQLFRRTFSFGDKHLPLFVFMAGSSGVGWTTEDYERGRAVVRCVSGDSRHTLRRPSPNAS